MDVLTLLAVILAVLLLVPAVLIRRALVQPLYAYQDERALRAARDARVRARGGQER